MVNLADIPCYGSNDQCVVQVDSEMESNGVSSEASPILGIVVVIVVFIVGYGITDGRSIRFSPPAQPGSRTELVKFFLGWDLFGFLAILFEHVTRIFYWQPQEQNRPILQLVVLFTRVAISFFVTYSSDF